MKQWFYRGSLKSCNYHCSYCPFSKRRANSRTELTRDEKDLSRFVDRILEEEGEHFAVQIVPYGEALIHPYYMRELARLSRGQWIELLGCQSNFSFPIEEMLGIYESCGGILQKLRLWGTFHPEMTTVEAFISQCECLEAKGVRFCVGVVGEPGRIALIRQLRSKLPRNVYLWINRMDGLNRAYQSEEIAAFSEIDPYFRLELSENAGNKKTCLKSCFVEADGTMRHCNIATGSFGNLYGDYSQQKNPCRQKRCSCFLAYCNQDLPELLEMGEYPAFRLPINFSKKEEVCDEKKTPQYYFMFGADYS